MLRCAQHDVFKDLRAFYQLVILSEAKDLIKSTGPQAGVQASQGDWIPAFAGMTYGAMSPSNKHLRWLGITKVVSLRYQVFVWFRIFSSMAAMFSGLASPGIAWAGAMMYPPCRPAARSLATSART